MACTAIGMSFHHSLNKGCVTLIGAGPGDPDLLTLKAVRRLAVADIILIDDLANDAVLVHATPSARVIRVGKRGGCKSTPQAFIERLMVRYARQGKRVARVKGGDPFMFGRGGEEVATLRAAGIPVEVIPGITAGIAAPAAIGIPVTHRDWSRGVTFITGHTKPDGAALNWQALAASGTTLIIYMGMKHIDTICAQLIAAGMSPETPAACVSSGTLPEEAYVTSVLQHLPEDARIARLSSPAIIAIGDVVRLARPQEFVSEFVQSARKAA